MYFASRHRRTARVEAHRGSAAEFLRRHEAEARSAARSGAAERQTLLASLFGRVADTRNLLLAAEHVCRHGGPAPGPDGISPADLDRRDVVGLVRALRDSVLTGGYTPGPVRRVEVPKANGGVRVLSLQNV